MYVRTSLNFIDLIFADVQLHTSKPVNPNSPEREISKALRKNEPGRYYMSGGITAEKDGSFSFPLIPLIEIAKLMERAIREGKRFRMFVLKSDLNIYAGKDTVEYMEAQKRKAFDKANNLNKIKR
jgi:hypothetical protein